MTRWFEPPRVFLLWLLFGLLLMWCGNCECSVKAQPPPSPAPPVAPVRCHGPGHAARRSPVQVRAEARVERFVARVNPAAAGARARALAAEIVSAAELERLDPMVLAAVLAQESSFRPGVLVCYPRRRAPTCDHGLGQINTVWRAQLPWLDLTRLVADDGYCVRATAHVLATVRARHARDQFWWTYYHSAREDLRAQYARAVARRAPQLAPTLAAPAMA